jgi:hypothetical protein
MGEKMLHRDWIRSLALLAATALAAGVTPACSLEMDPLPELEEEIVEPPPPLLEFETPYADLIYTDADDETPDMAGVQLTVRVLVRDTERDLWLEDIGLGVHDEDGNEMPLQWTPVHEDWRGRRCAEMAVSFFPQGKRGERYTLKADAGEGLAKIRQQIRVVHPEVD